MRISQTILIVTAFLMLVSCAGESEPASPMATFKTYTKAIAQKDPTTMKLLLSAESIKMHEQQAKAQGLTLDDIVRQETLFTEGQKVVKMRNEKINGDKATLEVRNSSNNWETVFFVFEDGEWKIDKKGYADLRIQESEQKSQQLDDIINAGRQP